MNEARPGARDQHARRGRCRDVDIADIDRAADHGAQLWKLCKDITPPFRQAVGDDDIDILGNVDQVRGIERVVALVQFDVGHRAQTVEAALAVILAPHLRRMGQQHFQYGIS